MSSATGPTSLDPNNAKQAANVIGRNVPQIRATALVSQPMMAHTSFCSARAKHASEADYPCRIHGQEYLGACLQYLRNGCSWTHVWRTFGTRLAHVMLTSSVTSRAYNDGPSSRKPPYKSWTLGTTQIYRNYSHQKQQLHYTEPSSVFPTQYSGILHNRNPVSLTPPEILATPASSKELGRSPSQRKSA